MTAPTFTPVPATRTVGEADPPGDMNNTSNELSAIGATYSVMNTAYSGGANPNTAADSSAAFAAALAALPATGGVVTAPAGTFSMANASALAMSTAGSHLVGAGRGATVLQISGSLSASQLIAITANYLQRVQPVDHRGVVHDHQQPRRERHRGDGRPVLPG